jgi:2-methylcitrate dehydratase PrpD
MEFSQSGGMVKRLHAGRAAEAGIVTAYLARDGFTGPHTVFEGMYGFCNVYSSAPETVRLDKDLGEWFAIREITVKPYCCCSDLHATIDCIRAIKKQANLNESNVRRIVIDTYRKIIEQNVIDGTQTIMAAQYSVLFTAAAALLYEMDDPGIYEPSLLRDPRIPPLIERIELRKDPVFEANYPRQMSSRVTIECVDGRSFTQEVVGARGHFSNPLSDDEIRHKFRRMTVGVIGAEAAEEAISAVNSLHEAPSVERLAAVFRQRNSGGLSRAAQGRQ